MRSSIFNRTELGGESIGKGKKKQSYDRNPSKMTVIELGQGGGAGRGMCGSLSGGDWLLKDFQQFESDGKKKKTTQREERKEIDG